MEPTSLTVRVPAKLNLFLEIVRRRDDGFHEIDSLMAPVSLFDRLTFRRRADDRVRLRCVWDDAPDTAGDDISDTAGDAATGMPACDGVPCDERNLVVRAIRAVQAAIGTGGAAAANTAAGLGGFDVTLVKRIPVESGLGGGSADAAATLVAVNRLYGEPLSMADLSGLAAGLGSDVPFFLVGGAARCGGRGEILEPLPGPGRPLHFVLVRPASGFSTATAYRLCRPAESAEGLAAGGRRPIDAMLDAWATGDPQRIGAEIFNRFEPIVAAHSPSAAEPAGISAAERAGTGVGVRDTLERLRREPVCGVGMSGSGTCCFALCHDAAQATRLARQLTTDLPSARRIAAVFLLPSQLGV